MEVHESIAGSALAAFRDDARPVSKRAAPILIKVLIVTLGPAPVFPQVLVDTFAGGRIRSGVPAQDVALSRIAGLAWDADGDLFFCERSTNLIRRVRPDGIVETVAGNGTTGFSGDGGPAVNAALHWPGSPRVDARGNLYFLDFYNFRIRRIDPAGVITTVAGNGILLRPGMNLEGPALARSLGGVIDIAVDRTGNVVFTELDSDVIRRVTADGRIEIFAGVPHSECPLCSDGDGGPARSAKFATPGLLAFDGAGNLYVGEGGYVATRIRRIASDGTVTRFAGYGEWTGSVADDEGKPALNSYLYAISGMAADAGGNVIIIQEQFPGPRNSPPVRIRRIDANGIIRTVAGGPGAQIRPYGLAVDQQGDVAFAESTNFSFAGAVRVVTAQSTFRTLAGGNPKPAPDGTPAREAWLLNPVGIAINPTGDLYVAEWGACLVRKIAANGVLTTAAGTGKCGDAALLQPSATQDLAPPASIAIDSGNRLYVMDVFANSYMIAPDGKIEPVSFPLPPGPGGRMAIDSKGRVHVLSMFSLVRISPDGSRETIVSPPSQPGVPPPGFGPTSLGAIGVDPAGNVYFTGTYLGSPTDYVFRVNDDGTFRQVYGSPSTPLTLSNLRSLAVDSRGNVWLADGRVSMLNASGRWSLGRLESQPGYSGDGGYAQSARFNTNGLALAPNGDLYILDGERVRKLTGLGLTRRPVIAPAGIVNALSYTGEVIAPGELVSIFGSDFGASGLQVNALENNRVPRVLGRTKVLFDGIPGAIAAIAPNQINVFVPYSVEPGRSVKVEVQVDETASAPVSMPVAKAAPGLATADQSGAGQGAILNQDGSINSTANPAARGSIVSLFGSGEGRILPQLRSGDLSISTPFSVPAEPVAVTIGGQQAEVTYAGAAPFQAAGVFQINARIPNTVTSGDVPVSVTVGGLSTSRQVTVAVR